MSDLAHMVAGFSMGLFSGFIWAIERIYKKTHGETPPHAVTDKILDKLFK